jgi:hypothetical protein
MNKKQKTPINISRILDVFIDKPTDSINYDDIIELRKKTSESRIREALRSLERINVLNTEYKRGRPRMSKECGSQSGRYESRTRSKNYRINLELDIFKKIFNLCNENDSELFLSSNYIDKMIEKYTFQEIYNQLQEEFKNHNFRRDATSALLNQSAAIKEYEEYPEKIYDYLQDDEMHPVRLEDLWFDEIQILDKLDPVTTMPFIRNHLINNLMELYKRIGGRRIHLRSQDGQRLIKLDMHLSPFFSYPFFDPIQVIFSKPFDRLYDDIYVFDKEDLKIMAERIYLIYANFADFLFDFISSTDWRYSIRLENSLREYVFLWNCQSYYFSEFYERYNSLFSDGCYYITSNSGFIQVIDLIKDEKMITPQDSFSIKSEITYPPLFTEGEWGGLKSNSLEVLMPCRSLFDEFSFDTSEIPIDTILEELRKKVRT